MEFPDMIRLRQHFDTRRLDDVEAAVARGVAELDLGARVRRGQTVAIGCSSRGISRYAEIVGATVRAARRLGLEPFLFPAMGSHGAATAEGQVQVLADAGITEASMGCPVRSSLEVVGIGRTAHGVDVVVDRNAWSADHVVLVNRVRSHTEFTHEFESGLQKMMAIGMGKEVGASAYHRAFLERGYGAVIRDIAEVVIGTGKFLFGVGIVENGHGETARVEVAGPERLYAVERALLAEARRMAPRLPFEDVDVLVVEEMGKEVSGTGVDTKVVGRILMPLVTPEPESPRVKRIVVLDLTERTRGNADGIGIADFVTRRLVDKIDRRALYVNALAGSEPEHARIPMTMDTDREAVEAGLATVGTAPPTAMRVVHIRNTARLEVVAVSAAYRDEIATRDDLEIVGDDGPMAFDPDGTLRRLPRDE
ncbi:MAG: DUF2088 domain-containing protein [Ectothiorhodospiraceae bacterium]|nr:DUF2088 domain-containing protein [Chromatiales bacterium]MCP5153698.1 DUF2088 domain-containing protein [Ectothiorhodospiraceae bacterium]